MIHQLPPFIIDEKKLLTTQEQLQPLLEKIDEKRNFDLHAEDEMKKWIEIRMKRYYKRLAGEFHITKEKHQKEVFAMVVKDIASCTNELLKKDSISWSDLSLLHTKLYPKGLWGPSKNSLGQEALIRFPAGEFRKKEEFTKTPIGDFYFLPYAQIPETLQRIDEFFHAADELHFLIRLILMLSHTVFVHPYYNGNGTLLYFYMGILLLKKGYPIPFPVDAYFTNPNIGRDLSKCNGGIDYMPLFQGFLEAFEERK